MVLRMSHMLEHATPFLKAMHRDGNRCRTPKTTNRRAYGRPETRKPGRLLWYEKVGSGTN